MQGRLPQSTTNGDIETLLTPVTAQYLHVMVGSVITLRGDFFTDPREMFGGTSPSGSVHVRVVGLFTLTSTQVSFWHGETFQPASTQQARSYTFLVPNEAFLTTVDDLAAAAHADTVFSPETFELLWRYRLDTSRITVDQVNPLINSLTHLQTSIANEFGNVQADETQPDGTVSFPYLVQVQVFNPTPGSYDITNILDQYRNYAADVSVPLTILTLQVFGLLLFFVSLLAHFWLNDRLIPSPCCAAVEPVAARFSSLCSSKVSAWTPSPWWQVRS